MQWIYFRIHLKSGNKFVFFSVFIIDFNNYSSRFSLFGSKRKLSLVQSLYILVQQTTRFLLRCWVIFREKKSASKMFVCASTAQGFWALHRWLSRLHIQSSPVWDLENVRIVQNRSQGFLNIFELWHEGFFYRNRMSLFTSLKIIATFIELI